ncbi:MAG: cellulase [Bacteroidales bacterium]|nr:cellulase [Bacteroidales bacterium]
MKVTRYSLYQLCVILVLFFISSCSNHVYISVIRNTPIPFVPKALIKDSLSVLTERSAEVLKTPYLDKRLLGERKDLPGWEGYPVKLYEYYTPKDIYAEVRKKGLVYLLNPSPHQLAMWVMTTCWYVKHNLDYKYTQKILEWIKNQSNAQFPIAGMIYKEDIIKKELYIPYIFKNGVTVLVADSTKKPPIRSCCNDELLHYYLALTDDQLKPYTGSYACICNTTREQYREFGGMPEVGYSDGPETRKFVWSHVVGNLYKKAYKSKYNELMIAWARVEL